MPRPLAPGLLLVAVIGFCAAGSNDMKFVPLTHEFVRRLDDNDYYNRYAIPTFNEGTATNVTLSMYIEGISSFSAQSMDFALDIYFQQSWHDKRLKHNGTAPMLIRDKQVLHKIWHPDLYFANARHASFQDITDDNFLIWLYPDGKIWYDCRISMTVICAMDLRKYPLDSQTCELRILSYAYPESQLYLRWSTEIDPAIDQNPAIRMPDMTLQKITSGECNGTYATGVWSCQTAVFKVDRQMMHHIMQTYVPSGIIIVISWFNFWLDIDSAPARVSLSITVLLTISTQANAVKLALPEVSYLKAIDVWLGVCLGFAFGVMIEFTICHYAKNQEMHRAGPQGSHLLIDSTLTTLLAGHEHQIRGTYPYIDDEPLDPVVIDPATVPGSGGGGGAPIDVRLRHVEDGFTNGTAMPSEKPHRLKPSKGRSLRLNTQTGKRMLSWTRSLCNIRGRAVAVKIDERSRIVFPLTFIVFNFIYWSFYLYAD